MGKHRGQRRRVSRRIGLLLLALMLVASLTFGVARAGDTNVRQGAATAAPRLGITGNIARFQSQTGQASSVHHAFLGWGHGLSDGSTFTALLPTLAPIPMIHLGTEGRSAPEAHHSGWHCRGCTFLKTHDATEVAAFYESRPGSRYDLEPKPKSRGVYRECITPLAGKLPPWAAGNAPRAEPKVIALKLTANPGSGTAPLDVQFSVAARLSVPIVHWQLSFGDGSDVEGAGAPPATVPHQYALDGSYERT